MDIEQARYNMVEQQIRPWDVLNQAVLDLLSELVDKSLVVAEEPIRMQLKPVSVNCMHWCLALIAWHWATPAVYSLTGRTKPTPSR